jgi:holin-like protein
VVQAAVLIGFWKAGAWVVETTGAPVPGAVMGLCFVLALLGSGLLPVRAIQHGAKWLMGEMLLFFVPPLLALLDFPQFFGALGLKLLVAIAVSTLAVMLAIALTIDLCCRVPRVQRAHALTRARRARVRE